MGVVGVGKGVLGLGEGALGVDILLDAVTDEGALGVDAPVAPDEVRPPQLAKTNAIEADASVAAFIPLPNQLHNAVPGLLVILSSISELRPTRHYLGSPKCTPRPRVVESWWGLLGVAQ